MVCLIGCYSAKEFPDKACVLPIKACLTGLSTKELTEKACLIPIKACHTGISIKELPDKGILLIGYSREELPNEAGAHEKKKRKRTHTCHHVGIENKLLILL